MKIAEIFLPRLLGKLKQRYREPLETSSARFVHYTSAEAALKIIRTKCLWMRNVTCMVDYREAFHGRELLRGLLHNIEKRQPFFDALDSCMPNLAGQAVAAYGRTNPSMFASTYITCLSEHDDREDLFGRLSMWRAFGTTGPRVALVFRLPSFAEPALNSTVAFSPVLYSTDDEFFESVKEVTANVIANRSFLQQLGSDALIGSVTNMFARSATCLKHCVFEEEREWRGIHMPGVLPSPLITRSVETIGGVPQDIFKLPLDGKIDQSLESVDFCRIFDRLIVGPTDYPVAIGSAFMTTLIDAGVEDAGRRITLSHIPIRSN